MLSIHIEFTVGNLVGIAILLGFCLFCVALYWIGMNDGLNNNQSDEYKRKL